jgi:hypothetical protein
MPFRDVALQASALSITVVSFWVYFDGLERLSNLEANLWAVAVLFTGGFSLFTGLVGAIAGTLLVLSLYWIRTRRTVSTDSV